MRLIFFSAWVFCLYSMYTYFLLSLDLMIPRACSCSFLLLGPTNCYANSTIVSRVMWTEVFRRASSGHCLYLEKMFTLHSAVQVLWYDAPRITPPVTHTVTMFTYSNLHPPMTTPLFQPYYADTSRLPDSSPPHYHNITNPPMSD